MSDFISPTEFEDEDCNECGIQFKVPAAFFKNCEDNHTTFYCPNGHALWYPPDDHEEGGEDSEEVERLKDELESTKRELTKFKCIAMRRNQLSVEQVREPKLSIIKRLLFLQ